MNFFYQLMKTNRIYLTYIYIFLLFLIAIIPINGKKNATINDTYILHFRLDHIFHLLFLFPWMSLLIFFPSSNNRKLSFIYNFGDFKTIKWFLAGLLLAISTEGVQYFLPYRSFTLLDLLFNISGLFLGWLCFPFLKNIINKR